MVDAAAGWLLLFVSYLGIHESSASFNHHQVDLPWQQYFRVMNSYHAQKAGRPDRIRAGHGRYRILPRGAELICEFPPSVNVVSNVVWERADLGIMKSLDEMYKSVGETREYALLNSPHGSTLHLFNISPLDRGLYRCMASVTGPHSNSMVTVFQDVPFYPEFGYVHGSKYLPPLLPPPLYHRPLSTPSCCRVKEIFSNYRHHQSESSGSSSSSSTVLVEST